MRAETLPPLRLQAVNDCPVNPGGEYVLYWMIAARRTRWNFALDWAIERAAELGKPLLVFEPLRVGYRWASDRFHRFVLDGMAANQRAFAGSPVTYLPYVEPTPGAGSGLLAALAARAAVVVTDEFPCFFLPRMVAAAARALPVRLEQVDGNGLMPLRASDHAFGRAFDFRRFLQKELLAHLQLPRAEPLAGLSLPSLAALPADVLARWPAASEALLRGEAAALAALPIDHAVGVSPLRGGQEAAGQALARFLARRLARYGERNQPDAEVTSGLSPYLHFGHVSAHEIFDAVARQERWDPSRVAAKPSGSREGWWGMSPAAEGFLDQLVTWREVGLNFTHHRPEDYDRYESLPAWCREELDGHAGDPRPWLYTREQFERAATHEELWNAAQRQIRAEGLMHNYLRMLWGKMILEWSASPREALTTMIELNNQYGLDGRDPNSYSGIFWCLGRYDRPWAPQRPVFGSIRYMSPANTRRKLDLEGYLRRWGRQGSLAL